MEEKLAKNYKIAVLGNERVALGFKLSGITTAFTVSDTLGAESKFKELLQRNDIGIIIIGSAAKKLIRDRRLQDAITSSIMPLVVEIAESGEEHAEEETLRKLILRAIGIDITKTIR
ncbi:MAG: hypothetical protein KGI00_01615 [Candidatus Micrarchaeota archaeon]|nr:hypothetical protein [Candidatus Micrarchaeota archaeon]MDE1824157.1 hypothetical protein [Candidatus Micrarchaeota archaeon]MDE1849406.1 hypothetical protein [Candidatus Micrarchaeota archaeon]